MTPEVPIRPHYQRPPLVEQAISVSFEPPSGFSIADFGLFWLEIRDQFPTIQTAKRLEKTLENFDGPRAAGIEFNILTEAPIPRALYRANSGEVIHLQDNRFGYNWAKLGQNEYPRSEHVMGKFEHYFDKFKDFAKARGMGSIVLDQCEITNLNILPVDDFGTDYSDLSEALKVDPLDLGIEYLPPETLVRQRQHRILNGRGEPIGRLHISISPVISNQDQSKAFRFELTARSANVVATLDDARSFFAIARNAINGAFQSLVTDKMKAIFGQER
jgi:uncharacterized protein (TIGR04255 family)